MEWRPLSVELSLEYVRHEVNATRKFSPNAAYMLIQPPMLIRLFTDHNSPRDPEHNDASTRNKHQAHESVLRNIVLCVNEAITQRLRDSG